MTNAEYDNLFFTMADFAGPAPPRSEADLRGDKPIEYDSTPVHARGGAGPPFGGAADSGQ